MKLSGFAKQNVSPSVSFRSDLPEVDQLQASELFYENGVLLTDVTVFAKCADNPELQDRLRSMLKTTDNIGSSPDTDDKELLSSLDVFNDYHDALRAIDARISALENEQNNS